jgi:predicted DCC family thiol-disulfide oxidoreductase YuxK
MPDLTITPNQLDLAEIYGPSIEGRPILLFDGVCVFCNHTVQFLLRRDRHAILRFVPLESPLGQWILSSFNALDGPEGVVLITNTLTPAARLSRRTEAFSDALILIGGTWRTLGKLIRFIPRPLRGPGYNFIARYRYRIFGKYSTCPIPTPAQHGRILGIQ